MWCECYFVQFIVRNTRFNHYKINQLLEKTINLYLNHETKEQTSTSRCTHLQTGEQVSRILRFCVPASEMADKVFIKCSMRLLIFVSTSRLCATSAIVKYPLSSLLALWPVINAPAPPMAFMWYANTQYIHRATIYARHAILYSEFNNVFT